MVYPHFSEVFSMDFHGFPIAFPHFFPSTRWGTVVAPPPSQSAPALRARWVRGPGCGLVCAQWTPNSWRRWEEIPGWEDFLAAWWFQTCLVFHLIDGMSSQTPLTNSIIFQDGYCTTNQLVKPDVLSDVYGPKNQFEVLTKTTFLGEAR